MKIKHIGLVCGSEENADRFYISVMGLEKAATKTVPAALCKQIFNLDSEYRIVNYIKEDIHLEIFIDEQKRADQPGIEHCCIEVDDLEAFLATCREMKAPVNQIPRGDACLTFVSDYDGNLFEIKQAPLA